MACGVRVPGASRRTVAKARAIVGASSSTRQHPRRKAAAREAGTTRVTPATNDVGRRSGRMAATTRWRSVRLPRATTPNSRDASRAANGMRAPSLGVVTMSSPARSAGTDDVHAGSAQMEPAIVGSASVVCSAGSALARSAGPVVERRALRARTPHEKKATAPADTALRRLTRRRALRSRPSVASARRPVLGERSGAVARACSARRTSERRMLAGPSEAAVSTIDVSRARRE